MPNINLEIINTPCWLEPTIYQHFRDEWS